MKEREQLAMIIKNLYDSIDALHSIKYNVMKNVNILYDSRPFLKNIFKVEKDLKNIIEELFLLVESFESLEEHLSNIRCTAPPLIVHQDLSQLICNTIFQYCKENDLHYRILSAPVKVILDKKINIMNRILSLYLIIKKYNMTDVMEHQILFLK